jgi:predicted HicB family RNase H-like nuclease
VKLALFGTDGKPIKAPFRIFQKKFIDWCNTPCDRRHMPNKRASNKRVFSVSIEKTLLAQIEAEAKRLGIDRNTFIKAAADAALKRKETK